MSCLSLPSQWMHAACQTKPRAEWRLSFSRVAARLASVRVYCAKSGLQSFLPGSCRQTATLIISVTFPDIMDGSHTNAAAASQLCERSLRHSPSLYLLLNKTPSDRAAALSLCCLHQLDKWGKCSCLRLHQPGQEINPASIYSSHTIMCVRGLMLELFRGKVASLGG